MDRFFERIAGAAAVTGLHFIMKKQSQESGGRREKQRARFKSLTLSSLLFSTVPAYALP